MVQTIEQEILASGKKHKYLNFPINTNGSHKDRDPYHWTLLVFDTESGVWTHYNSMKPRGRGENKDYYFEDAKYVKTFVDNFIKEKLQEIRFLLCSQSQDFDRPIEEYKDTPQQNFGRSCYVLCEGSFGNILHTEDCILTLTSASTVYERNILAIKESPQGADLIILSAVKESRQGVDLIILSLPARGKWYKSLPNKHLAIQMSLS